jgi:hypothetical protein
MVRSYAALVTCGFRAPVASVVINEKYFNSELKLVPGIPSDSISNWNKKIRERAVVLM